MKTLIVIVLMLAAFPAVADDAAPLDFTVPSQAGFEFDVAFEGRALIERRQLAPGVKVRGWQIAKQVYFGQARVADRWGLGLVYEDGDTVYGVTHRGLQWMRRF